MTSDLETRFRQLVMETRQGNSVSYKALLSDLAPLLRRMAAAQLSRFGKAEYADDVTQDALLAVHLKLHTYDEGLPFLAWARAVTRHKLVDTLRRLRLGNVSIDEEAYETIADPAPAEMPAIKSDLAKLLGQLKPPAGDIIYALRVEGATVQELAGRFSLSESNVKILVHRGLQKLARLIGDEKLA